MTESILQRVRQIAADIFNLPLEDVTSESSPETVETWDSIEHLNLLLALESSFKLHFSPEETADMQSIGAVARLVEAKVAGL